MSGLIIILIVAIVCFFACIEFEFRYEKKHPEPVENDKEFAKEMASTINKIHSLLNERREKIYKREKQNKLIFKQNIDKVIKTPRRTYAPYKRGIQYHRKQMHCNRNS